jgi:hypothetical protein
MKDKYFILTFFALVFFRKELLTNSTYIRGTVKEARKYLPAGAKMKQNRSDCFSFRNKLGVNFSPKMENNFRYNEGQRGAKLLVVKGFIYNSDKNRTDVARWRCQTRACPGMLFITMKTPFNHPLNITMLGFVTRLEEMK